MTTSSYDKFVSDFKFSGSNYEEAVLEFPKLYDALELMAGKNKVGYLLSEDLVREHMAEPVAPVLQSEVNRNGSENLAGKSANRISMSNYEAEMTLWRKKRDVHDVEWATLQTCLGSLLVPQSNAHTLFKSAKLGIVKFKDQFEAQWKALCKWEPKLSSDVEMLVEKLKSLDDSSGWGKFEGEWNDTIGKLKAIIIGDKVAIPEDVNDIFAKAITNTNMRVMVVKDYYEGKEDTSTWEMMMGRISRLIRKNKDWDTFPNTESSLKVRALSTSSGSKHLGKRTFDESNSDKHCFCCGGLDHLSNRCNASKCETCGLIFGGKDDRMKHMGKCLNRNDNMSKKKFYGDKPSSSTSSNNPGRTKKSRFSGEASEGGKGRTVFMVDARSAKVMAKALKAVQQPKSGSPGQGSA